MTDYIVVHLKDSTYQVRDANVQEGTYPITHFQGSLADCNAWIQLRERSNL